ncbi:MAG TPA: hypothetical protein VEG44_04435 [Candidatus Acidoferrales bacterium]|nr:hypothetical protein [Candidatus Acidoferrales bacterium]
MASISDKENSIEERLHYLETDGAGDEAEASPWERLPDESGKAYHAFRLYLCEGHWRSLTKVAEALCKNVSYESQLEKWSVKYNWFYRARAFDTYVETMLMKQYLAEQQAAFGRHIEHASQLEEKVFDELMSYDLKEMKPSELIRLYDIASKIERDTWVLKSEVGKRISNTYFLSHWPPPPEVLKRVIQTLKEAGALSENPVTAGLQISDVLESL